MLRTAVFAASIPLASSFEIVSQTFDGNVTTHSDIPGVPSPPSPTLATAYLGLDMERVSVRTDSHVVIDMEPVPNIKVHTDTTTGKIFDVNTKRYTAFTSSTTIANGAPPTTKAFCVYYEFPGLKDAATVKKCLTDAANLMKPVSSEGGLQKFEMSMTVPVQPGVSGTEIGAFYTDASFLIKKTVSDTNVVANGMNITTHTEMLATNSTAGAPDSSVFTIPAEWGSCEKATEPFDPSKLTGPIKVVMQCVGVVAAASEQPVIV